MQDRTPIDDYVEELDPTRIKARLGVAARTGWQALPDIMLLHQRELGIGCLELNVWLQVSAHWWHPKRPAFLRTSTIASRIGIKLRQVQRALKTLEAQGMLKRSKDTLGNKLIDPSPAMARLEPYAMARIAGRGAAGLAA